MKHLLILLLFLLSITEARSQILMAKPYLLIHDTVNNTRWKLQSWKKVTLRTVKAPDHYYKGHIRGLSADSIYLNQGRAFCISDIDYLYFKPKSKFRRYVKLLYYGIGAGMATYIAIYPPIPETGISLFTVVLLSPFYVAMGEAGGLILQLMSPRREFYMKDGWVLKSELPSYIP